MPPEPVWLRRKFDEWLRFQKTLPHKYRILPYPGLVKYYERRKDGYVAKGGDPDVFDDAFSDIDISVATDSWYDLDGELEAAHILALPEEEYDIRRLIVDEFNKVIEMARNAGLSERMIRSVAEEAGIPVERIQRIKGVPKEEYEDLKRKLQTLKEKFGEIVPVGPPRVIPPEKPIPPLERIEKPPPTAVEARAERLVEQIGKRILETPNYYSALGLPMDAKTEDIMDTVRLYISTYHPDVYPKPEATAITRRIIEIRDILTDPAKRRQYDAQLGVPAPPTVPVAVGRPVVYCTQCQIRGRLVMMEYVKTFAFDTGRSYDLYICPDPTCKKERLANFFRGEFLGFGK